jgi:hypothetical protein
MLPEHQILEAIARERVRECEVEALLETIELAEEFEAVVSGTPSQTAWRGCSRSSKASSNFAAEDGMDTSSTALVGKFARISDSTLVRLLDTLPAVEQVAIKTHPRILAWLARRKMT